MIASYPICTSIVGAWKLNFSVFPILLTALLQEYSLYRQLPTASTLSVRTVVISSDKSLARQMIFVLSWFVRLFFPRIMTKTTSEFKALNEIWPSKMTLLAARLPPRPPKSAQSEKGLDIPPRLMSNSSQNNGVGSWINSWLGIETVSSARNAKFNFSSSGSTSSALMPSTSSSLPPPKSLSPQKLDMEDVTSFDFRRTPPTISTESRKYIDIDLEQYRKGEHAKHLKTYSSQLPRIAGYLKRVQPDFALLAIRPYDSLMQDVWRSLQETNADVDDSKGETGDVATAFLCDLTQHTVRKVKLRREDCSGTNERKVRDESWSNEVVTAIDEQLASDITNLLLWWEASCKEALKYPSQSRNRSARIADRVDRFERSLIERLDL